MIQPLIESPPQRVLMVAHTFPPQAAAGTHRIVRFAKYLPQLGWQPVILTITPDSIPKYCETDPGLAEGLPPELEVLSAGVWHPVDYVQLTFKRWLHSIQTMLVVGQPRERGPLSAAAADTTAGGGRLRILLQNWLRNTPDTELGWVIPAVVRGIRKIRSEPFKVIYSTGPPHSAHLISSLLGCLTGLPVVLDFRDPWSRAPWNPRRAVHHRVVRLQEEFCVRRAAALVLNTQQLEQDFRTQYMRERGPRLVTISNGLDPELMEQFPLSSRVEAVAPADLLKRSWVLCHPGSVYGQRNLGPLVAAIHQLRSEGLDIRFEQIGHVSSSLGKLATEPELSPCFRLRPAMPHAQLLDYLRDVDLFVVLQQGTGLQLPSKLFEMVLLQKPILALTGPGATAEMIDRYKLGAVIDGEEPVALAAAIRAMLRDSPQFRKTARLREAYRDFDAAHLTGKLAAVLDVVVSGRDSVGITRSIPC